MKNGDSSQPLWRRQGSERIADILIGGNFAEIFIRLFKKKHIYDIIKTSITNFSERGLSCGKELSALYFCLLLLFFSFPVYMFAEELPQSGSLQSEVENKADTAKNWQATLLSCKNIASENAVSVNGTIKHNVLVANGDNKIYVYRLPAGKSFDEYVSDPEIKPLATADIRLNSLLPVSGHFGHGQESRYAVALWNPENRDAHPAAPLRFSSVDSAYSFTSGDKSGFKGVMSSSASVMGNMSCGTVIIPVYLDRLLSSARTVIFITGDRYVSFDRRQSICWTLKSEDLSATGRECICSF